MRAVPGRPAASPTAKTQRMDWTDWSALPSRAAGACESVARNSRAAIRQKGRRSRGAADVGKARCPGPSARHTFQGNCPSNRVARRSRKSSEILSLSLRSSRQIWPFCARAPADSRPHPSAMVSLRLAIRHSRAAADQYPPPSHGAPLERAHARCSRLQQSQRPGSAV